MNDEEFQKRLEELIEDRRSGASELVRLGLGIAARAGGNEPSGTGDASMARRQGQQYLL